MSEIIKNEVIDALLTRRSIRSFTGQPVSDDAVNTILECAIWAPSGMNQQTAVYVAIRDKDMLADLAEEDKKFGRMGPPPGMKPPEGGGMPPGGPPMGERKLGYGAPCLVLVFSMKTGMAAFDAPLGEENLCIAAHAIGLGTCILGGMGAFNDADNSQKWMKRLGIPENYEYISAVAVGYAAAPTEPKPRRDGRRIMF